jgi:hypothetical protein
MRGLDCRSCTLLPRSPRLSPLDVLIEARAAGLPTSDEGYRVYRVVRSRMSGMGQA